MVMSSNSDFLNPNSNVLLVPSRPTSPAGSVIGFELVPSSPLLPPSSKDSAPRIVVVVDDCITMRGERWRKIQKAVGKLASKALDKTKRGIDLHFLHWETDEQRINRDIITERVVLSFFDTVHPNGSIPSTIGWKLRSLLAGARINPPILYLFFLSGRPCLWDNVETQIVNAAKAVEDPESRLRFEFIQFGDDADASNGVPLYAEELVKEMKQDLLIADLVHSQIWTSNLTEEPQFDLSFIDDWNPLAAEFDRLCLDSSAGSGGSSVETINIEW